MAGISGTKFLTQIQEIEPKTVRMLFTAYADLQVAMDAINEGHIFRFLTKPLELQHLLKTIQAGVEQYHLLIAERELLEETLQGSIRVLVDILAMTSQMAFARAQSSAKLVASMAQEMDVIAPWRYEVAAMLSLIGFVTIPDQMLTKYEQGESLTTSETELFEQYPDIGSSLIERIPRLEDIAQMIAHQLRPAHEWATYQGPLSQAVQLGAQMIKITQDYEARLAEIKAPLYAIEALEEAPDIYNTELVAILRAVINPMLTPRQRTIDVMSVQEGMILVQDLYTTGGMLVLKSGTIINTLLRARLQNYAQHGEIARELIVTG